MTQYDLSLMRRPSVPLHVEVADLIRNQILSGQLSAGAKLPSISQLSADLNIAKMTIRQAMDSLEAEGMIDRQPGRGTFVNDVGVRRRQFLRMEADINQLFRTVEGLKVGISAPDSELVRDEKNVSFSRIHVLDGDPFCLANLTLSSDIYDQAPERFDTEIAILVLRDLAVPIASARQRVQITHADASTSKSLGVHINSPLMWVNREFFDEAGTCIYAAQLTYPSDSLGFEIEFTF